MPGAWQPTARGVKMSDLMSVEQHPPGEELAAFEEEVDGVPVLVDVRTVTPATTSVIGAAQAVVVAATSFAAGAATLALVRRHGARKQLKRAASRPARRGGEALEIVASRRFMVDIHLLDKPGR
jgi:hypothetical protein